MKILTPEDFKTTAWSGGKTTELFIFPLETKFSERDFSYRISVATITVSSSDFTPLPGVDRTLLLLEGELKLIHENHHEAFLMPFTQDSFKGDWKTHSIGIAKDFNLMTMGDCRGVVSVFTNNYELNSKAHHLLLFAYEENASINESIILEGNLAFIDKNVSSINLATEGKLVVVEVFFVD